MKQHAKPDTIFGRHENRSTGGRTFELRAASIAPQLRIYRTITVHAAQLLYIRHQDGNPITDSSKPSVRVGQLADSATRQFLLSRHDRIGLRVPFGSECCSALAQGRDDQQSPRDTLHGRSRPFAACDSYERGVRCAKGAKPPADTLDHFPRRTCRRSVARTIRTP